MSGTHTRFLNYNDPGPRLEDISSARIIRDKSWSYLQLVCLCLEFLFLVSRRSDFPFELPAFSSGTPYVHATSLALAMAEQTHRLSLPLIWGFGTRRGQRASNISLASKSSNGETMESPTSPTTLPSPSGVVRHSMPPMTWNIEHVQRISTVPLHAPAPVISRTRPDTPVATPRDATRISHSVPSHNSTTGQGNSQIHPARRIDRVLQRLKSMRQKKKEGRGRSHKPIILALVAFILTAVICIAH